MFLCKTRCSVIYQQASKPQIPTGRNYVSKTLQLPFLKLSSQLNSLPHKAALSPFPSRLFQKKIWPPGCFTPHRRGSRNFSFSRVLLRNHEDLIRLTK